MLLTLNAENPSRALAYVRVSSQRQVDEGVSIEAQIKRIKEYARYKGLSLEDKDILIEKGVSGGIPIWERPVGRNLKMRLETGEYPLLRSSQIKGLAVGLITRYPCDRIRVRGPPCDYEQYDIV